MAKYSWQNNSRSRDSVAQWGLVGSFAIASLVFLTAPLFHDPLGSVWRWVSLDRMAVSAGASPQVRSQSECVVIATPPHSKFDVVNLVCSPSKSVAVGSLVWYRAGAVRYLVGHVTHSNKGTIIATLFSTSNGNTAVQVRFGAQTEKYSALPIGAGSLRVELPDGVSIIDGAIVYHAVSGQPLGVVAAQRVEKGSYVKRVYIRLPFSFESLTRLEID